MRVAQGKRLTYGCLSQALDELGGTFLRVALFGFFGWARAVGCFLALLLLRGGVGVWSDEIFDTEAGHLTNFDEVGQSRLSTF